MITPEEARKYLGRDIPDERVKEILGYLYGMVETIIRQERKQYEKAIRNKSIRKEA